jgi:hypothetical protein
VICGGKGWSRAFLWPRPLSRALKAIFAVTDPARILEVECRD